MVLDHAAEEALQAENFKPSDFIHERLKGARTGDEARRLQGLRADLAVLNSASSEALKSNVFQNFQQFIDAAKEISNIEQEVYQLSSLLSEQRTLIDFLMSMSADDKSSIHTVSSTSTFASASAANTSQMLIQKMDGAAAILNSLKPSERVVLHGEATLLDPDTKQAKSRALLVLVPDRLLVGNAIGPAQPGKYALESAFSLNSLAAVNVRDRDAGGGDAAGLVIKLLIFPDQRYYRLDSARTKQSWLDGIETAKRAQLREGGLQRQATIRGRRKVTVAGSTLSLGTIRDDQAGESDPINKQESVDEATLSWLRELPSELEDCLSAHAWEDAVELLAEWRQERGKEAAVDAQITLMEQKLVNALSADVSRPSGSHGGPKAMHRARTLLTNLGRGVYAVELYLTRRSTLLRAAYKNVAVSEEPLAHVRQLSGLYSTAVADVLNEFSMQPEHYCQVLQFCSREMSVLLAMVRRHVIEVVPTMAVLSRTWKILMRVCDELTDCGAQLTFELHRLLCPAMSEALSSNFKHIIHAFRLRLAEERWRGTSAESESSLLRLCEELADVGLRVDWAAASPTSLHIAPHTLDASRAALSLAQDLAPLRGSPLGAQCDSMQLQMWREFLAVLLAGAESDPPPPPGHAYSANFVLTQVLPLCESSYYDREERLTRLLQDEFSELVKFAVPENEEKSEEDEEVAHC